MARLGWVDAARSKRQHRAYRQSSVALCGAPLGAAPVWRNRAPSPCSECSARDPERAEFIEQLIDYLAGARLMRTSTMSVDPVTLDTRFFDGAEPFLRTDLTHGDARNSVVGAEPSEVSWPVDLRIITRFSADDEDDGASLFTRDQADDQSSWNFQRFRSMTMRELRGRVLASLPYPLEWTIAHPFGQRAMRFILGHPRAQLWVPIEAGGTRRQNHLRGSEHTDIFSTRGMAALGIWKARREQWRVYFSIDGKPGIELPSDPVGVRAAFRLRDIPPGKSRRAALLHWVTEHWRMNRYDPTEEVLVREHLAGQRAFAWNGLRCKITPSRIDQDRAEESTERRQEARMVGADRRVAAR